MEPAALFVFVDQVACSNEYYDLQGLAQSYRKNRKGANCEMCNLAYRHSLAFVP